MGNNIREIIKENGIKATFVIERTGLSSAGFYAIANGESVPNLQTARKISKALNKPLDEVFPEENFNNQIQSS